jgi:hypothetical protein
MTKVGRKEYRVLNVEVAEIAEHAEKDVLSPTNLRGLSVLCVSKSIAFRLRAGKS